MDFVCSKKEGNLSEKKVGSFDQIYEKLSNRDWISNSKEETALSNIWVVFQTRGGTVLGATVLWILCVQRKEIFRKKGKKEAQSTIWVDKWHKSH